MLFYLQIICILGETLEPLDDDGIIPTYGFGDNITKDKDIFPLKQGVSIIPTYGFGDNIHVT